jgi:hypothetical protein
LVVYNAGVDPEYDQAINDIQSTERELNEYLEKQKKILGCRVCDFVTVVFRGSNILKVE